MPNQHASENLGVRAPADVRTKATAVLTERGISIQRFVVACLIAVAKNPDDFLRALKKYRPDIPTKGVKAEKRLKEIGRERW
jgi:antitoxin component of RelBE/YafQ-DinJ toxin-antitoxin module